MKASDAWPSSGTQVDSYVLGRLTLLHDPDADRALRAAKYLALTHACLRVSQVRLSGVSRAVGLLHACVPSGCSQWSHPRTLWSLPGELVQVAGHPESTVWRDWTPGCLQSCKLTCVSWRLTFPQSGFADTGNGDRKRRLLARERQDTAETV